MHGHVIRAIPPQGLWGCLRDRGEQAMPGYSGWLLGQGEGGRSKATREGPDLVPIHFFPSLLSTTSLS